MAYKTIYRPTHPEKYLGDITKIIARSLWERRFMKYCDETPGILHWGSEEIAIPYISPVDSRGHFYYPDFFIEVQTTSGVQRHIVEIKPDAQCRMPTKPSRQTRRWLNECATYAVNQAKWESAKEYCRIRNWNFLVLTEKHLFGKE